MYFYTECRSDVNLYQNAGIAGVKSLLEALYNIESVANTSIAANESCLNQFLQCNIVCFCKQSYAIVDTMVPFLKVSYICPYICQ